MNSQMDPAEVDCNGSRKVIPKPYSPNIVGRRNTPPQIPRFPFEGFGFSATPIIRNPFISSTGVRIRVSAAEEDVWRQKPWHHHSLGVDPWNSSSTCNECRENAIERHGKPPQRRPTQSISFHHHSLGVPRRRHYRRRVLGTLLFNSIQYLETTCTADLEKKSLQ